MSRVTRVEFVWPGLPEGAEPDCLDITPRERTEDEKRLDFLAAITERVAWKQFCAELIASESPIPEGFDTYWIVGGHFIREQIGDDRQLTELLRSALQPYKGERRTLYRGESIERWESGNVGFAWTEDIQVAEMFAAGLNAVEPGGVLLVADVERASIISGPNKHSAHLQENQYTVDPFASHEVRCVRTYPVSG